MPPFSLGNSALTGGFGTVTNGGSTPGSVATGTVGKMASSSGGAGAGADSVTPRTGGNGGDIQLTDSSAFLTGGAGGIESGTINGSPGNNRVTTTSTSLGMFLGATGGGGGGGQSSGGVAGNGGNGGIPGASGGGGGGSLDGTNSGTGGDGGRGEIWVIEYLG